MTKTQWAALAAGLASATLVGILLLPASDGAAQRQPRARTGAVFVRATAGNITINVPVRDGAEGAPQALLGSPWSCSAERAAGNEVSVTCSAGSSSMSFRRAACDPLSVSLGSAGAATYEVALGCE
ncbi:MAG: hypothetical protein KF729_09545 [Sandaracinaceae bacterium]|nr:hypothetical protein [Sandaracinaceae bacterium]